MEIQSSLVLPRDIYHEYLDNIQGIKFTAREIDVIVCIMHGKSAKGIANFLSTSTKPLSAKSVETHILNIRRKIKGAGKDSIISFVEKSDQYKVLDLYYSNLLIYQEFHKVLEEIKLEISKYIKSIRILCSESQSEQDKLIQYLCTHLGFLIHDTIVEVDYTGSKELQANLLLIRANWNAGNLVSSINLTQHDNYYSVFFEILDNICNEGAVRKVIQKFVLKINAIISGPLPQHSQQRSNKNRFLSIIFISITIALFCCFFFGYRYYQNQIKFKQQVTQMLMQRFDNLSTDNLTRQKADNNYPIIKQFDVVVEKILANKLDQYFVISQLNSVELLNCIYNLNSVGSYYFFKENAHDKAIAILSYAKSLTENFIASRSKVKVAFDALAPEEVYTELEIIKDLPEMYAITLYALGKAFMCKRIHKPEYFTLSYFLANKTGIFEAVSNIRNGLAMIKSDKAIDAIQNKNFAVAKQNIRECIEIYQTIACDSKRYKINYKPGVDPTFIIPKDDVYHVLDCNRRIMKLYRALIEITDDRKQLNTYLSEISQQYLNNANGPGLLVLLKESEYKYAKIVADSYNILGNLLLEFHDKNISFDKFKDLLTQKLNLRNQDELMVISQIFEIAKSLSRTAESTKIDSHKGLRKVRERLNTKD